MHNTSYTSSDLYWDCELLTSIGTNTDDDILTDPVVDLADEGKFTLTACFTPLTDAERRAQGFTPVCINEVSAANTVFVNEFFKRNDWVELFNTTDKPVDVKGMYLSDDPENPQKYQITAAVIPAHGYLIVWCDKLEPQSQLHAPFKLAAEGGTVLLTAADGSWTDRISYTPMKGDETVGRYPDGSRDVVTMNVPTIGKPNLAGSYSETVGQPVVDGIREVMARHGSTPQIYNLKGQAVEGTLRPGIYIQNGRKFIKK